MTINCDRCGQPTDKSVCLDCWKAQTISHDYLKKKLNNLKDYCASCRVPLTDSEHVVEMYNEYPICQSCRVKKFKEIRDSKHNESLLYPSITHNTILHVIEQARPYLQEWLDYHVKEELGDASSKDKKELERINNKLIQIRNSLYLYRDAVMADDLETEYTCCVEFVEEAIRYGQYGYPWEVPT